MKVEIYIQYTNTGNYSQIIRHDYMIVNSYTHCSNLGTLKHKVVRRSFYIFRLTDFIQPKCPLGNDKIKINQNFKPTMKTAMFTSYSNS